VISTDYGPGAEIDVCNLLLILTELLVLKNFVLMCSVNLLTQSIQ